MYIYFSWNKQQTSAKPMIQSFYNSEHTLYWTSGYSDAVHISGAIPASRSAPRPSLPGSSVLEWTPVQPDPGQFPGESVRKYCPQSGEIVHQVSAKCPLAVSWCCCWPWWWWPCGPRTTAASAPGTPPALPTTPRWQYVRLMVAGSYRQLYQWCK